jgi:3-deoxy-D-arabino-heptulosonate 7-phosphate (DAHP) synthase class II
MWSNGVYKTNNGPYVSENAAFKTRTIDRILSYIKMLYSIHESSDPVS